MTDTDLTRVDRAGDGYGRQHRSADRDHDRRDAAAGAARSVTQMTPAPDRPRRATTSAQPTPERTSAPMADRDADAARTDLPNTAGFLPLLALIGIGSLVGSRMAAPLAQGVVARVGREKGEVRSACLTVLRSRRLSLLSSDFSLAGPPGSPTFKAESELVVLHVSVRDRGGRYITGLDRDAFTVIDDGKPQTLEMFSADDVPASVGLLIDNSNSMRPNRERVIASAVEFVKHSHPKDEIFVLTFNEHVRRAWGPSITGDTDPGRLRVGDVERDRRARHDRDLRRHPGGLEARGRRQAHRARS